MQLLGVGPIYEPVGVGASLIVRSGPPGVGASRKVLGSCFARGHGDIEGWAYLVEELSRNRPLSSRFENDLWRFTRIQVWDINVR